MHEVSSSSKHGLSLLRRLMLIVPLALLSACQSEVLDPAGDIALQQRDIIYISTALMLLIIVPVMALIVVFAWHYRAKNKDATYDPEFDHSTALELVIWSAPLLIIITLGALTWWSTHLLDPFRPLNRISAEKAIDPKDKPLVVQVVSLDWKWLFIYPEQGIATVNELALPVDRQVRFELTSSNMMNTFYAPTLAGMIYTMPGMRSTLHAVINRPGEFEGKSANYSGAGFSYMKFKLRGVDQAGFDQWVAKAKASGAMLDTATYLKLETPSERVPPMFFGGVESDLFDRVYNRCVKPGTKCMSEMMAGQHGHGSQPEQGQPEGALLRDGDQSDTGESLTAPPGAQQQPEQATPPAKAAPAQPKSGHDKAGHQGPHSSLHLPVMPGAPRAAAG